MKLVIFVCSPPTFSLLTSSYFPKYSWNIRPTAYALHPTDLPEVEATMVALQAVQAHNAALTSLASGPVAVFGMFAFYIILPSTMEQLLQIFLFRKKPSSR